MSDDLDEGKQRLREERESRERDRVSSERRRKRSIVVTSGAAFLALVVVVGLVLLGGGGGSGEDDPPPPPKSLLEGIPQNGTVLGDPDAPVTVVEFVDLQCPFCRDYSLDALPTVIRDYVRPGKVKLDLKVLSFLGPDSVTAGQAAYGAAQQDKLWDFVEEFFREQGDENSGYVTDEFLREVGGASEGLDVRKALADSKKPQADDFLKAADRAAKRYQVESTPGFVALRDGETEMLNVQELTGEGFAEALDPVLAK